MPPKKSAPAKPGAEGEVDVLEEFLKTWRKLEKEFQTPKLKDAEATITKIQEGGGEEGCSWNFTQPFEQMSFRVLMQAMRQTGYNKVTALRLWKCNGGDESVRSVCTYIQAQPPPPVEDLQFTDCAITELGCEFLSQALASIPNSPGVFTPPISFLRLDFNRIGAGGVQRLSWGLAQNAILKGLSLRCCDIEAAGGVFLAHILIYVNSALEELDIHGNSLREGILDVLKGAKQAKKLERLHVGDNKFSEDNPGVISAFVDLFQSNTKIEEYTLIGNFITDVGAQKLIHGITGQSHIKKFMIPERVSATTLEALDQALSAGTKKSAKKKGKKK